MKATCSLCLRSGDSTEYDAHVEPMGIAVNCPKHGTVVRQTILEQLRKALGSAKDWESLCRNAIDLLKKAESDRDSLQSRLSEVERERDALSLRLDNAVEARESWKTEYHRLIDSSNADRDSLRAQLEAVTKERDEHRQARHDVALRGADLLRDEVLKSERLTAALADAEKALLVAVELRTDQNCPPENHEVVIVAQDALDRIRAQQPQGK